MKITAKAGKEDIATVFIAEMDNGKLIEFVESVQPPIPREKKWVLIVSILYGCPIGCRFCDAGEYYMGKLYYLGDPQNMTKTAEGKVWQFYVEESKFDELRKSLKIVHHMRADGKIRVRCLAEKEPYPGAQTVQPTLEDAYLCLLGKSD